MVKNPTFGNKGHPTTKHVGPGRGRKIPNANGRTMVLSQSTCSTAESLLGQDHKMLPKIKLLLPQAKDFPPENKCYCWKEGKTTCPSKSPP